MTTAKKIGITGAAGQDGLVLGLKLIAAGHHVIGIVRSADQQTFPDICNPKAKAESLDSSTLDPVRNFLEKYQPDQIYHLRAKSSVVNSGSYSENTLKTNPFGALNWLNPLNELKIRSKRSNYASESRGATLLKARNL